MAAPKNWWDKLTSGALEQAHKEMLAMREAQRRIEQEAKRQEIERIEREKYAAVQQFYGQGIAPAAVQIQNQLYQQAAAQGGIAYTFTLGSTGGITSTLLPNGIASPVTADVIGKFKQVEPHRVAERVPDSVVPIIGWRAWRVAKPGAAPETWRLRAVGQQYIWQPKQRAEAGCIAVTYEQAFKNGCRSTGTPVPAASCYCGFWSFKNVDMLPGALTAQTHANEIRVLGGVALWGRVIETENGFRAQYAYPTELWLLDDGMEELGRTYGVPIRTLGK